MLQYSCRKETIMGISLGSALGREQIINTYNSGTYTGKSELKDRDLIVIVDKGNSLKTLNYVMQKPIWAICTKYREDGVEEGSCIIPF